MMIAPEVYYEENIARKSPKEICIAPKILDN